MDLSKDLKTFTEAMIRPDAGMWMQAMQEEMASQNQNKTWTIAPLPRGVKPLPVRWVYTLKRNDQGEVVRYKGRLVAKGFRQRHGIDYDEVFAPTAKWTTIRTLLAIATAYNVVYRK